MSEETNGGPEPESVGVALARLRWKGTTAAERHAVAVELNRRRWAGHKKVKPAAKRKGKRG